MTYFIAHWNEDGNRSTNVDFLAQVIIEMAFQWIHTSQSATTKVLLVWIELNDDISMVMDLCNPIVAVA